MLRNAVIHIANEQPFMADLLVAPSPSDVCLICRNMRTKNGKKPVFVDMADSTFLLPVSQIRFVEIPARSYEEAAAEQSAAERAAAERVSAETAAGRFDASAPSIATVSPAPSDSANPTGGSATDATASVDRAAELDGAGRSIVWMPSREGFAGPDASAKDGLDGDLLRRIREA
jgi:hypothetical protein